MSSPVTVLLLLRANDAAHADRAWRRMLTWEPQSVPSRLDQQIDDALRLTEDGADSTEPCKWDEPAKAEALRTLRR